MVPQHLQKLKEGGVSREHSKENPLPLTVWLLECGLASLEHQAFPSPLVALHGPHTGPLSLEATSVARWTLGSQLMLIGSQSLLGLMHTHLLAHALRADRHCHSIGPIGPPSCQAEELHQAKPLWQHPRPAFGTCACVIRVRIALSISFIPIEEEQILEWGRSNSRISITLTENELTTVKLLRRRVGICHCMGCPSLSRGFQNAVWTFIYVPNCHKKSLKIDKLCGQRTSHTSPVSCKYGISHFQGHSDLICSCKWQTWDWFGCPSVPSHLHPPLPSSVGLGLLSAETPATDIRQFWCPPVSTVW